MFFTWCSSTRKRTTSFIISMHRAATRQDVAHPTASFFGGKDTFFPGTFQNPTAKRDTSLHRLPCRSAVAERARRKFLYRHNFILFQDCRLVYIFYFHIVKLMLFLTVCKPIIDCQLEHIVISTEVTCFIDLRVGISLIPTFESCFHKRAQCPELNVPPFDGIPDIKVKAS